VPSASIDLRAKSQKNSPTYPMRIRITLSHHGLAGCYIDRNPQPNRTRIGKSRDVVLASVAGTRRKQQRRREMRDWLNIECELHVPNHWRKAPNSKTGA
jgi:hypothetical protein